MTKAQRVIAILGLLVILVQFLIPPVQLSGRTSKGRAGVIDRRMPIWSEPEELIVLGEEERGVDGAAGLFVYDHSVNWNRLGLWVGVISTATILTMLLVPSSRRAGTVPAISGKLNSGRGIAQAGLDAAVAYCVECNEPLVEGNRHLLLGKSYCSTHFQQAIG